MSHASKDDSLATRIGKDLAENSISVWIDHQDLRRRGLLREALQTAIERCRHVVLLWSRDSSMSRYVSAEWNALKCRPDDPGALNGLGSILWLRGDLDAAEFYIKRSIERAREEAYSYPYAEEDLRNIQRERTRRGAH